MKPPSPEKQLAGFIASLAVTVFAWTNALATEPFGGPPYEVSVTILELPVGLRNIGMGTAGVSSVDPSATAFYNPAALAWADAARLSFGYQDLWVDDTAMDTRLSFGNRWDDDASRDAWCLGGQIGYTVLDINLEGVSTIFLPPNTGDLPLRDYYFTTAVAGAWERNGKSIGAGVSGKYLKLDFSDSADSWLLDYGLVAAAMFMFDGSMIRPRAGISVTNNDTGIVADNLEYDIAGQTRYGIGIDFASPPTSLWGRSIAAASAAFDADYVDSGERESYWALGWEVSVVQLIQARAGYKWYDASAFSTLCLGFGIGWEFGRWIAQADYAHYSPVHAMVGLELDRDMFGATFGARF